MEGDFFSVLDAAAVFEGCWTAFPSSSRGRRRHTRSQQGEENGGGGGTSPCQEQAKWGGRKELSKKKTGRKEPLLGRKEDSGSRE